MDGTQQRRNSSDRESDDKLATWDPMKDAYESPVFNSYENKTALEMSQDPRYAGSLFCLSTCDIPYKRTEGVCKGRHSCTSLASTS